SGVGEIALMDFKRLNLDSEGAFSIVNQEAGKARIGFDSIDYELRCADDPKSAPVWVLRLLDSRQRNVGTYYLAADNGAVLRKEGPGQRLADTNIPAEHLPAIGEV